MSQGTVTFEDLKIYYRPQANSSLKIKATSIDKFYRNFLIKDNFTFETEVNNEYYYTIDLNFKKCDVGEVYRQQIQK